jgi:uncharacterized protein YhbP (UPF0306 family)
MKINFNNEKYSDDLLNKSISEILENAKLWSMATVNEDLTSHINTAYFCYDDDLRFYFLTSPISQHSNNVRVNKSIACSVFNTEQPWGQNPLRGIQLFGSCELADTSSEALGNELYGKRFPSFAEWMSGLTEGEKRGLESKFYCVSLHRIKLLDEKLFGEETYVDLSL